MLAELTRLAIAPAFVALITLAGRRSGPATAGYLAALPVVAGPILALLVAEHGRSFGATSAFGSAIGTSSTMVFALVYAHSAARRPARASLLFAYLAYCTATVVAFFVPVSWPFAVGVPWLCWLVSLRFFPRGAAPSAPVSAPTWDLPMRLGATFVLVALITQLARALGPVIAGLVTPFPIITAVLAVFSHTQGGPVRCAILLRALVRGLASFVAFFLVVAFLLARVPAVPAFAGALLVCCSLHVGLNRLGIGAPPSP